MTNYLGIATATEIIRQLLENEIQVVDSGAKAAATTPDKATVAASGNKLLNLFLYHVTPNLGYRNMDLPLRDSGGQFVKNPQIALDLHYLLTAYSDSTPNDLAAQQMLAIAMRTLEENSVLTRDRIAALKKTNPDFQKTDLDAQVEIVKLSIEHLSLEEISKLWSSFFQTNYRLSVFYKATVILLDGTIQPKYALRVANRFVYVSPFNQPFIEKIDPQITDLSTPQITLSGRNIKSDGIQVMFDGVVQTPQPANVSENQIIVDVPKNITPGIKQVKIINPYNLDKSSFKETIPIQSNIVSFVLAPMIVDGPGSTRRAKTFTVSRGKKLALNFMPAIDKNQKVSVLIGDTVLPSDKIEIMPGLSSLSIIIPDNFPVGQNYLLRLRVDDIENFLVVDDIKADPNYGKYIEPNVAVK